MILDLPGGGSALMSTPVSPSGSPSCMGCGGAEIRATDEQIAGWGKQKKDNWKGKYQTLFMSHIG